MSRLSRLFIGFLLLGHVRRENLLVEQKVRAALLLGACSDNLIQAVEHIAKLEVRPRVVQLRDLGLG